MIKEIQDAQREHVKGLITFSEFMEVVSDQLSGKVKTES